ncbi:MAG: sigma-70 family RNA polymerase sigma factor [Verrucomicrobiae bacterium]|nr:sigma-70 family RNA polymerase sigma factor [Verrucomicrobiae bacterium]
MIPAGNVGGARPSLDAGFRTTHWSAVLAARDQDSPQGRLALAELCQSYWYPLYAYIRRLGHEAIEAEDLTQAFFERLLEKNYIGGVTPGFGRFRSFLLTALKHFLANEWDRAQTQRRGGGLVILSFDDQEAEIRYQSEPADHVTPETLFDRRWAFAVLDRVLARLREEFVASEREELFDQLKIFLTTDLPDGAYGELAVRTGLKPGTIRVAVHRLRRRYGELLRSETAKTVNDPKEVEEELRHLVSILSQ